MQNEYNPPNPTPEMFNRPALNWLEAVDMGIIRPEIDITPEIRERIKYSISNLVYNNGKCDNCGSIVWWNDNGTVKCIQCQKEDEDYATKKG